MYKKEVINQKTTRKRKKGGGECAVNFEGKISGKMKIKKRGKNKNKKRERQ